jgi:hypothetical protein
MTSSVPWKLNYWSCRNTKLDSASSMKGQIILLSQTSRRNQQGSRAEQVGRVGLTRNQRMAHDITDRGFSFGRKHGVMESLDEKWSDGMVVFDDDTVALDIFSSGFLFELCNRAKWAHWISWNGMVHSDGVESPMIGLVMASDPSLMGGDGKVGNACDFDGEGWLPYDFMRAAYLYS